MPRVVVEQLRDDVQLAALARRLSELELVPPGERGEQFVWIQAAHALIEGNEPEKLFARNIRDGAFERSSNAAELTGLGRWKRWRESHASS